MANTETYVCRTHVSCRGGLGGPCTKKLNFRSSTHIVSRSNHYVPHTVSRSNHCVSQSHHKFTCTTESWTSRALDLLKRGDQVHHLIKFFDFLGIETCKSFKLTMHHFQFFCACTSKCVGHIYMGKITYSIQVFFLECMFANHNHPWCCLSSASMYQSKHHVCCG